jgi:hypothetical protein
MAEGGWGWEWCNWRVQRVRAVVLFPKVTGLLGESLGIVEEDQLKGTVECPWVGG